jgi:hypothetical protein
MANARPHPQMIIRKIEPLGREVTDLHQQHLNLGGWSFSGPRDRVTRRTDRQKRVLCKLTSYPPQPSHIDPTWPTLCGVSSACARSASHK